LLPRLAHRLGVTITTQSHPTSSLSAFQLTVKGWDVEVVGSMTLPNGIVMQVDEEMLANATGSPLVESAEDLVAELLVLNRPEPKQDLKRACTLVDLLRQRFQVDRCKNRLLRFGLSAIQAQRQLYPILQAK
jgi:hypothetical protein